jgi:glycosyltransferase involved in cell wall biosynthesis
LGAKFVFVINSFLAGGAERSLLELLPHLVNAGITPIVVCLSHSDVGFEAEAQAQGFDIRFLPAGGTRRRILALRRLIADEQPDLVYTALFEADIVGRLAAIRTGVPVMSVLANTTYDEVRFDDPNIRPSRLRMVKAADGFTARNFTTHFHAVSDAAKDSAVENLRLDPSRITVVRRGRDEGRLGVASVERRRQTRTKLGIDDSAAVVISIGRQEYQKGHRFLVAAFAGALEVLPDALLVIAGREGHASPELQRLIDDLDVEGSVLLLGHRQDVPDLLAASDVFAFPSLYEGLGGAVIEAMALSLPVIASDLPAIREVVREGENAVLTPPRDERALRDAIVDLLGDPQRRAAMGSRSRQIFEADYRADDAARRLVDLLTGIAAP